MVFSRHALPGPRALLAAGVAAVVSAPATAATIEEILVTADFRRAPAMDYAASLSVVGPDQIHARSAQHLQEVLNVAPNVNYAAGASRGRYIQIRGIGERSQFVDPINPSVGLTIDGIDLSGVGNAGTLFDVAQVEVLRGPQGTRFGANGLAGMVNITSNAPTESFEGRVTAGFGNYDRREAGLVLSGPLTDELQGRLAVEQHKSDGFIENIYLDRDDTQNRDEFTGRGRLRWEPTDDFTLDTTLFYVDVDNGYDAFSLDNNRKTRSDQPGKDTQETFALAFNADWRVSDAFRVQSTLTMESTNIEYSFDEDWTNTEICEGLACDSDNWGFNWWYSSTDRYLRDRRSTQLDLRLLSEEQGRLFGRADWVAGLYVMDMSEELRRELSRTPEPFMNDYDTTRTALYGQLTWPLTERLSLTAGGRVEDFSADYSDSRSITAEPDETLWGGRLALEYDVSDRTMVYGLISRGFKAGGVNGEALGEAQQSDLPADVIDFLEQRLVFETETADNLEVGFKGSYWEDRWQLRVAAFYMEREDVQLRGWYNQDQLFVGYTDNGASGENMGVELETSVQATDHLRLFANIGLLDTEIQDFFVLDEGELVDQSGRDQGHAPNYQYNVGADLSLGPWSARMEVDGRDAFYFSDSHDQRSDSYALLHASLGYEIQALNLQLWGRNLTDRDYATRGFYFANDPRDFYETEENYVQLGAPRTWGVTATWNF